LRLAVTTRQSADRYCNQPSHGRLGREVIGSGEGMKAVARELSGGDIASDLTVLDPCVEQVFDERRECLLRMSDVVTLVQQCSKFVTVVLVPDERVRRQDGMQSLDRTNPLSREFRELFQMSTDLAFVPRMQDRVHVREVLVQRGAPDADLLRHLRHRHGAEPTPSNQRCGGVHDRLPHRSAMLLDRLRPQLGHS